MTTKCHELCEVVVKDERRCTHSVNLKSMTRLHSGKVSPWTEIEPSLHLFGKIQASPDPSINDLRS